MKIETKQISIVQVYDEPVTDMAQLKIADIRNKIIELWERTPTITQFPDLVAIIDPIGQLSAVVEGRKVTVSYQDSKEFASRDIEKFALFIIETRKILSKPLKAFGFNYAFFIDFSDDVSKMNELNKKLVSTESLKIKQESLIGNGLNVSYTDGDDRIQIMCNPVYDVETLKTVIGLEVQTNVHFAKNEMPAFSEFVSSYKTYHEKLKEKLISIFS